MAVLRANPASSILLKGFFPHVLAHKSVRKAPNHTVTPVTQSRPGNGRKRASGRSVVICSSSATGKAGVVGEEERGKAGLVGHLHGEDKYLVKEWGWRVRRMVRVREEMRKVAQVQAEAFHTPVVLLNDLFFDFFKAEVLSGLSYRVLNSPPERYACLVAESDSEHNNSFWEPLKEIVGVVDVTVQRDEDVLAHIQSEEEEYLYVSGIAVLSKYRRQKVATALLKACDVISARWGFGYLALRAYEDDLGAQKLYANAGYKMVSRDPIWSTWIGKKRRVLMVKRSPFCRSTEFISAHIGQVQTFQEHSL